MKKFICSRLESYKYYISLDIAEYVHMLSQM